MSELVAVSDIERMAAAVAKSNLFGVKTTEQAMALMLIAQAEGLHPAIAARDYHVIQGRPSLKADAMLARFQAAGGKVKWTEYTDKRVAGTFSHPAGGDVDIDWTIEKARQLGFLSKDNWKNYPRAMMRARCVSEGVRTVYPGVVIGIYTPEEVSDMPAQKPKDMGTVQVIENELNELPDMTIAAAAEVTQQNHDGAVRGELARQNNEGVIPLSDAIKKEVHDKTLLYLNVSDAVKMRALWAPFDADAQVILWNMFDSKQKSAIKKLTTPVSQTIPLNP